MKVEKKSASEIGGYWFRCPSKTIEETLPDTTTVAYEPNIQESHVEMNSSISHTLSHVNLLILILLTSYCRRYVDIFVL